MHCLITIIKKLLRSVDGSGHAGALLTDLSKAFDCIDHELLIAKLDAYRYDKNSFYFINSHLKGRKQKTKINSCYSAFAEVLFSVPQGSILEPLLFNIYICEFFFKMGTLVLLIMLMTKHRISVYETFILSFLNFRETPKEFLDGFMLIT